MNSVRILALRLQHRRTLSKGKRKLINRCLCKAGWAHGMPILTIGLEAVIVLVMPQTDFNQAKRDVLGWVVDAQCFRRVNFTQEIDINAFMDHLRHAVDEVGWVNPGEAAANELLFQGMLRLVAMAVDRGYTAQSLHDVLRTHAELAFVQSAFPNQLSLFERSDQVKESLPPELFEQHGALGQLTVAMATDVVKSYSAERMRLFDHLPRTHWHLSADEVCILLDMKRAELNAWDISKVFERGLSSDQLQRITHALNLFACLYSIWGDKHKVGEWMRTPNYAPFLGGLTALTYLLEEHGHQRAWRELVGWVAQAI